MLFSFRKNVRISMTNGGKKAHRSYPQLETEETPGRKGLKERNIYT